MYLPEPAVFSLALLIGAVAAVNLAMLNLVGFRDAAEIYILPWTTRVTVRGWGLGIASALALVLVVHLLGVALEGSSAEAPSGRFSSETLAALRSPGDSSSAESNDVDSGNTADDSTSPVGDSGEAAQVDVLRNLPIEGLLEELLALDSKRERLTTLAVMSVVMAAIGASMVTVVHASQVRPLRTDGGPTPAAEEPPDQEKLAIPEFHDRSQGFAAIPQRTEAKTPALPNSEQLTVVSMLRSPAQPLTINLGDTPASGPIEVYISGAVVEPGVYEMRDGDRIIDLLYEAGGHTHDADLDSINLALRLYDEDQVLVPRIGDAAGGPESARGSLRYSLV